MSKVYILIPSHNNKKEVLELLGCLDRQTYKDIKIVLVDDGSADNTEDEARKLYPDTVILKGDGNLWWTGSNVMGVDYILPVAREGDFILLLNNDLVVDNDYIETLVKASMANERAITGSATVDYNNPDFIEGGIQLDHWLNLTVNRNRTRIEHTEFDMNVDVLPGRGSLVPVEVFNKIGSFNYKKLPHYGADYEFTLRARRAGYKLIICHKAKVFAKLSITGMESTGKKTLSPRECMTLLFHKKSKTNFYYYLNFVRLCSEKEYRVRNLIRAARGILLETAGKTYPFKIIVVPVLFCLRAMKRMILFIHVFLWKRYPLRRSDIERFNLSPDALVAGEVLLECKCRENIFYYLNPVTSAPSKSLRETDMAEISKLERLSFNYLHKIAIIFEKINILKSKEAVK